MILKVLAAPMNRCEVCFSGDLKPVLNLGEHALCDDLVPIGSDLRCSKYEIDLWLCSECLTVHQACQVKKELLFPKTYHYRARMTQSVLDFMQDFAESCSSVKALNETSRVLDIGCNDGSLLAIFKDLYNCHTTGIDPTGAFHDAENRIDSGVNGFFDLDLAKKLSNSGYKADLITFTNVFAHIERLEELCQALRLVAADNCVIAIENHYLGEILRKNQFDTFYHEHPRTYSAKSFVYVAKQLGRKLVNIEFSARYGGNIRAFIGPSHLHSSCEMPDESQFESQFEMMNRSLEVWKTKALELVNDLVARNGGPIVAKAFPGRAAILLELLGLDTTQISAIYEIKGSIKTGNYAPGTRIPILPEAELFNSGYAGPILNLAWHLPEEVRTNLLTNGMKNPVYDLLDEELTRV